MNLLRQRGTAGSRGRLKEPVVAKQNQPFKDMISLGGGLLLVVGGVYLLFFSERTWLKVVCGIYVGLVLLLNIVAAFRSAEPMQGLIVPGLIVVLLAFASSIRGKWKNWP